LATGLEQLDDVASVFSGTLRDKNYPSSLLHATVVSSSSPAADECSWSPRDRMIIDHDDLQQYYVVFLSFSALTETID